jgi:plasmid maintenance system antidote protein VapI
MIAGSWSRGVSAGAMSTHKMRTALRLGKFFKTGAAFWMNIQARFDLETAEDVLAPQIKKIASYEAA